MVRDLLASTIYNVSYFIRNDEFKVLYETVSTAHNNLKRSSFDTRQSTLTITLKLTWDASSSPMKSPSLILIAPIISGSNIMGGGAPGPPLAANYCGY